MHCYAAQPSWTAETFPKVQATADRARDRRFRRLEAGRQINNANGNRCWSKRATLPLSRRRSFGMVGIEFLIWLS